MKWVLPNFFLLFILILFWTMHLRFAESYSRLTTNVCRESHRPSLGKELFAEKLFTVRALPRVTLSKPFAESTPIFAECIGHSAKRFPGV
jgi:hypothetical protein